MKKDEAEKAIRYLCTEWSKTQTEDELKHPSFSKFKTWLSANHYSHYLDFRAVPNADYVAEMWFDQEFKQTWRN